MRKYDMVWLPKTTPTPSVGFLFGAIIWKHSKTPFMLRRQIAAPSSFWRWPLP